MRKLLALIGMAFGGYIGFSNRPAALLVGQLPFYKVILAGRNLQGLDKLLVPVARTSFNYMIIGAVTGLLCGLFIGILLARSQKYK